ncbi:exonuclease domain-containing protein [Bacillus massiliglaciei]|uniref:exonuclease domain-containing protein n=1 Tax=Bacillus massiliglaciei TaxID=1816693 RepID=UPI000AB6642F|nr:exonuclease domain-containing protein [Bacillus massiliglaciei]
MNRTGIMLDVETTGLSPASDEIIELAMMLFQYNEETGEILEILKKESFLREPIKHSARNNYSTSFRVHGIPFESVQGKEFHDKEITKYLAYADSVFAHNASFDRSFLYQMYPLVNEHSWFCTMRSVPWKKYGYPNSRLLTILQGHGIAQHQTHRAMDDINYLMELMKQTNPNGQFYLKEVISKKPMRKYIGAGQADIV